MEIAAIFFAVRAQNKTQHKEFMPYPSPSELSFSPAIPATTRATDAIRKTVAGSFKITMRITAPPSVDRREAKRLSLVPKAPLPQSESGRRFKVLFLRVSGRRLVEGSHQPHTSPGNALG